MLDKKSEEILKYAISKFNENHKKDICFYPSEFKFNYEELNLLCKNLRKKEYLSLYSSADSETDYVSLRLTGDGLNYFENQKLERREYYKKLAISKLSDIIVAFITSVITCANWEHISNFIKALFEK